MYTAREEGGERRTYYASGGKGGVGRKAPPIPEAAPKEGPPGGRSVAGACPRDEARRGLQNRGTRGRGAEARAAVRRR